MILLLWYKLCVHRFHKNNFWRNKKRPSVFDTIEAKTRNIPFGKRGDCGSMAEAFGGPGTTLRHLSAPKRVNMRTKPILTEKKSNGWSGCSLAFNKNGLFDDAYQHVECQQKLVVFEDPQK
uniref:Uncharacterized protein n=1 Tax=Pseudo-nitzschia australis TaxID=44445 RepID=A0A7S4AGZ6_9STRA